ncbi:MAG: hypothetical protein QMD96_01985 [Anaerosomatales bacterium]|nr:hypothetical protein [Anaerosomatales bacterium]
MDLSNSARHYLVNYFLMEQTRSEANQYLETIAKELAANVGRYVQENLSAILEFEGPWTTSGGGETGIVLTAPRAGGAPEGSHKWRYYVMYRDAMKTRDLLDPTHCLVWGETPKTLGAQKRQVEAAAEALGLPSPYRVEELPLLDASLEDTVKQVAAVFVGFMACYGQIVRSLIGDDSA